MTSLRGKHRAAAQPKAFGSLGLSAVVHVAALGALFGVGLYSAAPTPVRTLVIEAPPQAGLVEPAQPSDLTQEERERLEPLPTDASGPTDFAESWVSAPEVYEHPWEAEPLDEVPVSEWSDERLAARTRFEVRPLDPDVIAITPAVEASPEPAPDEQPAPTPPAEAKPEPAGETAAATEPLPAPPRLEGRDPEYPDVSQRLREEGDATLRLELDAEGRVILVELESSSGHRRLDQAAMSAAPLWRFDVTGLTEADRTRGFLHTVHFRMRR